MTEVGERFAMANITGGELNALVKKVGGEDCVRRMLRGELVVAEARLFRDEVTYHLPASGNFVSQDRLVELPARERFKSQPADPRLTERGELAVFSMDENFRNDFLTDVEVQIPATTLYARQLMREAYDGEILDYFGDSFWGPSARVAIPLVCVWLFLLRADPKVRYWFYIPDKNRKLRHVMATLVGYGWQLKTDFDSAQICKAGHYDHVVTSAARGNLITTPR